MNEQEARLRARTIEAMKAYYPPELDRFHAACDPVYILALLDELAALREQLAQLRADDPPA
jgi:hypothetical protein